MTINEQEQQFESNRLHHVIELIGNHIVKTEKITDDRKSNAWEIKREFWSDITVNVDDPDDIMETISAVKQQAFVLSTQENSKKHAEQQLYQLKRMKQSPYFARIDFIEEGTTQKEPIYIGIASFMDERTDEYWVYDWRAPISNLFYDYGPGPASYVTPMGSIEGRIELKRQYVIRNGIIKYMFDTGVTIGDEMLQQLLSKSADEHMKSIVATIQKEQNQIIRDDSHRLLIVQGSAGSGKTSVALQRVAYLLYKHRQSLNADNMVLFSPNSIFNSYVSSVLPELGEANMEQTTYQEYLRLRLGSRFELEDPYTQLEYVLTASADQDYNSRLSSIRYKASTEFFRVISSYKSYLEQTGMLFKNITLQGRILISGQTLANRFYQFDSSTKLANRIVLLKDWILKELRELEKQERRQEWVKNEIELLDKDQYYRAYNKLRKMSPNEFDSFDSQDREEEILSIMVVREPFERIRGKVKKLQFVNVPAIYKQLFTKEGLAEQIASGAGLPENWADICRLTIDFLDRKALMYEDATPLLFLNEMIQGFQSYNSVRHVLVDEAQDYTPFQYEFLKRLFPRAKMTLLGDLNQSIFAHSASLEGFQPLIDLYGEKETRVITLAKSYRSTRQIVEFTKALLPYGEAIEAFNREGDKPRVRKTANDQELAQTICEDIAQLRERGMQSIAIICKTAKEAAEASALLSGKLEHQLMTKDAHTFTSGNLIIPAYLAKGLEFDAVLVFNASNQTYIHEQERKLFYTACTRAMHHLCLYIINELCLFLEELSPALYDME